jgi:translation initiation factor IF-3
MDSGCWRIRATSFLITRRRKLATEPKKDTQRINEQIRVTPVRVIGDTGEQLGIMSTDEAIKAAQKVNLDLVMVAPNERPPVCRIMDFGKFKYQQKKRQHKGHAHQIRIKEIRVRPKTGDHDIEVKVSRAREFLQHKDKVIVTVTFRGRELAHIDEGRRVLDQIVQKLDDVGKIEAAPSHTGKRMVCTLAPK